MALGDKGPDLNRQAVASGDFEFFLATTQLSETADNSGSKPLVVELRCVETSYVVSNLSIFCQ